MFGFTYPLTGGNGDGALFAELDCRASVHPDATIEIEVYDYTSRRYLMAPTWLADMIDQWIRAEKSDLFHGDLDLSRRDADLNHVTAASRRSMGPLMARIQQMGG